MKALVATLVAVSWLLLTLTACTGTGTARLEATIAAQGQRIAQLEGTPQTGAPITPTPSATPPPKPTATSISTPTPEPTRTPEPTATPRATPTPRPPPPPTPTPYVLRTYPELQPDVSVAEITQWSDGRFTSRILQPVPTLEECLGPEMRNATGPRGAFCFRMIVELLSSSASGEVIETCIEGEFEGWSGETIFLLCNGQIWQQSSYAYTYHYAYRPKVLIYRTTGGYKMKVDGVSSTIYVRRLK